MFSTGYYISRRIYKKGTYHGNISSPVLKIAVGAVALGVIIMLIAICTGMGLQHKIQENIASFGGHVQITPPQNSTVGATPVMSLHQDFYPSFPSVPQVRHIYPYAVCAGVIKTDEDFESIALKGVGENFPSGYFDGFITDGKIPHFGEGDAQDSIIISHTTASKLRLKTGDRIKTYFMREGRTTPLMRYYTVSAIYKTDISDIDDTYAIGDIRSVQKINGWEDDGVSGFEIMLDHVSSIREAAAQICVETSWKYHISTMEDSHASLLDWVKMFDVNIWTIIIIMTLVCAVNMITVLLILILEKTSLIGLLRSMGATSRYVSRLFLWNALYIILRGLVIGNAIGLILLWVQHKWGIVTLDADVYSVEVVPVYFHWGWIAALNAGVVVINMLMLLLPAMVISKINPASTIRYE